MDNEKWYILQVMTGAELDVMKELHRRGVGAVIPIENRVIRSGGRWKTKEYIIFPGYVFINVQYAWSQYYIMSGIRQIIKILGGGEKPEPLSDQETELLIRQSEMFRKPSVIRLHEGGYEVLSGALMTLQDKITKLDLHCRRATVRMNIAGAETEFKMSFTAEETKADE